MRGQAGSVRVRATGHRTADSWSGPGTTRGPSDCAVDARSHQQVRVVSAGQLGGDRLGPVSSWSVTTIVRSTASIVGWDQWSARLHPIASRPAQPVHAWGERQRQR